MKKKLITALTLFCLGTPYVIHAADHNSIARKISTEIMSLSQPSIPACTVSITVFGAKGDGQTLCTKAFAKAIDSLSAVGGGQLVVPAGVWLTGPITLKSHIDLHLNKGAIILFAADEQLYPVIDQDYEGQKTKRCQSPISGSHLTDVAITGEGIIDGNGEYWRPVKRLKVTEWQWKNLQKTKGSIVVKDYWMPSAGFAKGDSLARKNGLTSQTSQQDWNSFRRYLRPVMVNLTSCTRVKLQGVTFINSPAWNIHPLMCKDVIIDGITVRNPVYAQNGDGLDIESCRNVLVTKSLFSTGDDAICLKSGKDEDGRHRAMPSENILIEGCTVLDGHGGVVIGSEMSGGINHVLVQNCQFDGTDSGIRIKACRGRGGVVSDIVMRNIAMSNIAGDAITADLYYGGTIDFDTDENGKKANVTKPMPVDETTPEFRDITLENISCSSAKRSIFINGLPEMPIRNITLTNINITADNEPEYYFCKNVKLNNVITMTNGQR